MTNNNKVFLLGNSGAGKDFLLKRILSLNQTHSITSYRNNKKIKQSTWKIDTRYYTADLDILVENISFPSIDLEKNGECQGIIIIFDPSQSSSFESVRVITEDIFSRYDPGVRICIGNNTHPNIKEDDCLLQKVSTWCLEHLTELISVPYHENNSENFDNNNSREKIGIPRIIEVLHANMWDTLSLKNVPCITNDSITDITNDSITDITNDSITGTKKKKKRRKKKALISSDENLKIVSYSASLETTDKTKRNKRNKKNKKKKSINSNNITEFESMDNNNTLKSNGQINENIDQIKLNQLDKDDINIFGDSDKFENLIQDIMTVRDNVKSQKLSDKERRKAAEDAVMKIYNILEE